MRSVVGHDPRSELEALLTRMRQRLYPETIPVLASYWLKTVCDSNHPCSWWKELSRLLQKAIDELPAAGHSRASAIEIQKWIEHSGVLTDKTLRAAFRRPDAVRETPGREWLMPYIGRLLNEWLSVEVASLLIEENEPEGPVVSGIPPLAIGKALERLLVRERLSPETLEMLLHPGLLSPRLVYPAHAEMLQDVVLFLRGRTWAPPLPVLPAAVLTVTDESPLAEDLKNAVSAASLVRWQGREEIHVPLAAAKATAMLKSAPLHLASHIVTMDGRWWEAVSLQNEEPYAVIYRPAGRLRIAHTEDHATIRVPWPQARLQWDGAVHCPSHFELFGRQWRAAGWELDHDHLWLHLSFEHSLAMPESQPASDTRFHRSHPASVDIAWTALGNGLSSAIAEHSHEPVEQLRRSEFVPLARALLELLDTLSVWRPKQENLATRLRAVRFLHGPVGLTYGKIPWRVLPESLCTALLKKRRELDLEVLDELFEGLPAPFYDTPRHLPTSRSSAPPVQAV